MRQFTTLPHDTQPVGVLWNNDIQKGNFDNWGRLPVSMIVLHSMDGFVGGTTEWFKTHNQSANYGVDMNGKITAWIQEDCVAYHAGKYSINQISVGIEHEDNGNNGIVRTDALYETSGQLVANLCKEYNIPCDTDHIKLHGEIIPTSCPGTLDRSRIIARANQILSPAQNVSTGKMIQVDSGIFVNIVGKSSEYDEVWNQLQKDASCDTVIKALRLDPSAETKVGSHKVILDYISQKVANTASFQPSPAIPQIVQDSSSNVSVLNKDIPQIVSEFLQFLRLKK